MELENKVIFVSGANRGIGKALVGALLKRGVAKIYAAARNVEQLPDFGDARVVPISLDITDAAQVQDAAQSAGDTEILINNAGFLNSSNFLEGSMDMIRQNMEVNYFGTLAMMRAFTPILREQDVAAMVNLTSIASFANFPFVGAYSASKAALYSITQGARLELSGTNIAVHSVNPGPIDTDMAKDVEMDKASPDDTAAAILDGLQQDVADIFPDPAGRGMFEVWSENYRDLEFMIANMMEDS